MTMRVDCPMCDGDDEDCRLCLGMGQVHPTRARQYLEAAADCPAHHQPHPCPYCQILADALAANKQPQN